MPRRLALAALLLLIAARAHAEFSSAHVKACAACHGEAGRSAAEGYYPSIAGKPADYLYAQLRYFRDGRRHNEVMAGMLAFLSDAYLRDIATYYAAQTPSIQPTLKTATAEQLRRGQALIDSGDPARGLPACRACHGRTLTGTLPGVPGLLGLPADYLTAQLGAWQTGKRRAAAPDCMATVAKGLSSEELRAVTAWLASQPYPAHAALEAAPPSKPALRCGAMP